MTLLGLGLAVDYALLIVARYREERAGGADPPTAIETAMARAGRAVAISGLAVAAALAGLTAFAEPLLASMALGGAVVVLLTTALALTAVPALIAVAGRRIPPAGAQTWVTRAMAADPGSAPASAVGAVRSGRPAKRTANRPTAEPPGPASAGAARPPGRLRPAPPGARSRAPPHWACFCSPRRVVGANFANSDARALPHSLEERRAYDAYQTLFARQPGRAGDRGRARSTRPRPALRDYLNELLRLPAGRRLEPSRRMCQPAR